MGRGKIEIKLIENQTNRQVTYSKRRNGIFKKAQELTVLCDAKVSLIMLSNTSKMHEYISPTTTTKRMYDDYQKTMGVDLWRTHYESMKDTLWKLKEINNKLRREIRQRLGHDLNGLSYDDLRSLEDKMQSSLDAIRERKYHVIKTQTETTKKKVKNLEERRGNMLHGYFDQEAASENPQYCYVDNEEDYESALALANGANNLYTFQLHRNSDQLHHPNLHHHRGSSLGSSITHLHDLRLA
ncbi:floral homeotic protein DEFICIENS-like [Pyrus ussuriensis x Pyrus communis]|uniref:Floral homeotic protein DEFICIENS-like n=1 Tax=Pyrus ussuriensis x Pyrus communis TaxID=2448454 RepID=A0A5N5G888_9ROSA|nr:agamous-like MADS-box protein TM6 isoform X1 [Pyrus x bretschneideri]KAB2609770.1 floral homeotic protein DEFICIENS-like [Pyrus ussuriensis x Pyrus communis]KAB2618127.1 floral homeotic protein DEFICIENS-like [Pyrus ussuriensis x Pyrus communis]